MPELPEVETIRLQLQNLIVGKKILDVTTDTTKQVQPSLEEVKKVVVGATIKAVKRRAKIIQLFLSNGAILIVHLKLTGRLLVRNKGEPKDDWQRVTFSLSGGYELRFADLRKFGWIRLVDQKVLEKILADYGPEPLDDLDFSKFKSILSSTTRPIKVVLMDQKKLSGIGNIYACDALNLAKIDPRRPAKGLAEKEAKKLLQAVEKVIRAGIKYRGASDQYYLDALGKKGSYQDHFLVYGRSGKECFNPACRQAGAKIKKLTLGSRGTYFCPSCQK